MHIWGKGQAAGRVGSGQTFCRQSRVGSGRVNVSPGRVGSKKSDPWTTLLYLYTNMYDTLMNLVLLLSQFVVHHPQINIVTLVQICALHNNIGIFIGLSMLSIIPLYIGYM